MKSHLPVFLFLFLIPECSFSQFTYLNELGIGINVPVLDPLHATPVVPALQLDFRHEFYHKTNYTFVDKSIEARIGFDYTNFSGNLLYMFNIGLQDSYRTDNYLLAFGGDLVGFLFQSDKIPGKFIDVNNGGRFGQGNGIGLFYKLGKRLNDSWSVTGEIGPLVYIGNFYTYRSGPIIWRESIPPSIGLYRANVSLNYHF